MIHRHTCRLLALSIPLYLFTSFCNLRKCIPGICTIGFFLVNEKKINDLHEKIIGIEKEIDIFIDRIRTILSLMGMSFFFSFFLSTCSSEQDFMFAFITQPSSFLIAWMSFSWTEIDFRWYCVFEFQINSSHCVSRSKINLVLN